MYIKHDASRKTEKAKAAKKKKKAIIEDIL